MSPYFQSFRRKAPPAPGSGNANPAHGLAQAAPHNENAVAD